MFNRKFALLLVVSCAVSISSALAESDANSNLGAAPIYRSRSGGSGMVDTIRKSDTAATNKAPINQQAKTDEHLSAADRAMISNQAISDAAMSNSDTKSNKRRVPLSRSGGSASASYVVVPK